MTGKRVATLATTAFLAILATPQFAEGTVVGTFKQEGEKRFVPYLPTSYVSAGKIDFKTNYGSLPIQQGDLKFSTTDGTGISYNATDGYYEAAGTATGRLTFPTKLRTKITIEPIALTWDSAVSATGLSAISDAGAWYNFGRLGFDGSKLLAISLNGHVATSTDGISWTRQGDRPLQEATGQNASWNTTTFGNGVWVAVNGGGYVATSTDGTLWINRGKALPSNDFGASLTFANGLFMTQDYTTKSIYTSPDGITWTQRGKCPAVARVMGYSGERWIAGQGDMYSSQNDGQTWTPIDTTLRNVYDSSHDTWQNEWYGTCFVGGKHYAINFTSGHLASSINGSNWKNLGNDPSFKNYRNITYINGKFISLQQAGTSLFVTNAGERKVQFFGLSLLTRGTTNEEYPIAAGREFVIESSQISDDKVSSDYHIDFSMQQIRLVPAEIFREPTANEKVASVTFQPEVNLTGNKIIAAIEPESRNFLTEEKIVLPAESTISADFVCDPDSVGFYRIPLGVQANLGTQPTELAGNWTRYKSGLVETSGTGTLRIEKANSMPQSDITIRDGGALEFTGNLDYTTGAGTVLDLRGCSAVSGGKSLTLGAGGKLIF
jgi:hypothetical protein